MPAQTEEQRLDVPLFRMLGSDPVYQYDFGSWKSSSYAGTKIPTFDEFICLYEMILLRYKKIIIFEKYVIF